MSCQEATLEGIVPNLICEIAYNDPDDNLSTGDLTLYVDSTSTRISKTISSGVGDGTLSDSNHTWTVQLTAAETYALWKAGDTMPQLASVVFVRNGVAVVPVEYAKLTPRLSES